MTIEIGGNQGQGSREEQQDYFDRNDPAADPARGGLGVVADGVGGLTLGGQVSERGGKAFLAEWKNRAPRLPVSRTLEKCLAAANDKVLAFAREMKAENNCASTIVAAVIEGRELWWVAAGDSRAYLIRESGIHQLNADHNRLMSLYDKVAAGTITREAAETDPERGSVTSALGMPRLPHIDRNLRPLTLSPGDRVLLCTDGVYLAIGEAEMAQACREGPAQACCDAIVRLVANRGIQGQDNYTAVLMTVADGRESVH